MARQADITRAGVLGMPVSHSLSPRLFSYWFDHYGVAGEYEAIATPYDRLEDQLDSLEEQGLQGVNLTLPLKERGLELMDETDQAARHAGAVNMVTMRDGRLIGSNTDIYGFLAQLAAVRGDRPAGSAVVLGAGGSARAVLAGLLSTGWKVTIAARTLSKAELIAKRFEKSPLTVIHWDESYKAMGNVQLLVNTTPLGMRGQPPLSLALDALPRDAHVYDLVYAPDHANLEQSRQEPWLTGLLARARNKGHPIISGLGMLLYQAQPAFETWFGLRPGVTPELMEHMQEAIG